jgi:hypothetical protein
MLDGFWVIAGMTQNRGVLQIRSNRAVTVIDIADEVNDPFSLDAESAQPSVDFDSGATAWMPVAARFSGCLAIPPKEGRTVADCVGKDPGGMALKRNRKRIGTRRPYQE